ncbi:MAG: M48 family metalloprotease [Bdellovibrionales bacterium]|nr:M48 family metalloprotease [Bdellovibrionales bacterium]
MKKLNIFLGSILVTGTAFLLTSCAGAGGYGLDINSLTTMVNKGKRALAAAEGLTPEQEYYLGRGVAARIITNYPPYGSPGSNINQYVNEVGQTLVSFSDMPYTFKGYHFMVLNSNELNAFATPSGFVFVTKGLVKRMPDEDALAAVLAHEIAHVVEGHGVGAVETQILTDIVTEVGLEVAKETSGGVTQAILQNTETFGLAIDDMAENLLVKGYSRSQEYDADEYAAELMVRAGYNPMGLVEMLKAIESVEKASERKSGLMETHPSATDRLGEVMDLREIEARQEQVKPDSGQVARAKRFKSRASIG